MKELLLVFLLVSCASGWKQKDFERELSDTPPGEGPIVKVSSQSEQELLKKFEVKKKDPQVIEDENKLQDQKLSLSKTIISKKSAKKIVKKTLPLKPSKAFKAIKESQLKNSYPPAQPDDYPEELKKINSKAKKIWSLYRPNHVAGIKTFLDIKYLGMTVGKIMITNHGKEMIDDKEVWHFGARFKSAPFYSSIYELDDSVDTFVTTDNFLSIRYSLIQRESKQNVDDLQLHDRDQLKTFWFYHREKSNGQVKDKKIDKYIPYFSIDPFSILFFFQGLPLKNKDLYEIPIINKGKVLILKSVVEGRELIETNIGKKKAIRIHSTTNYSGETLKSGDMYFWFSDDQKRTFLRASAKIKIGSVLAEIVNP